MIDEKIITHQDVIDSLHDRIAALEAIIDAAPHQKSCRKLDPYYKASSNICDCWKSKIVEKR